jgi:hypothetical protein
VVVVVVRLVRGHGRTVHAVEVRHSQRVAVKIGKKLICDGPFRGRQAHVRGD